MNTETYFILFETDLHKSKSCRVIMGVFSSFEIAIQYAKKNNCYSNQSEVVILETGLDKFKEM